MPAQNGAYSARCETSGGCRSDAITLSLTYSVPPAPQIVSGPTYLCTGESTTLTASGCQPEQTVRWSNDQSGQTLILSPQMTANYTAACALGEVLSEPSQQIQITVGNPLIVTGRTNYSIGETVSLTAVSSAPGVDSPGSITYV